MIKIFRSLFKINHNKYKEIEILDEEPRKTSKSILKKISKTKIITFIISFIIIFLFTISLISGKNIALVGAKKVLNNLGIYTEEVSSIEINSSLYNDEGSWNINKSAKWTSSTTAKIEFNVDSVVKPNGNKKDIIIVIDTSGSMEGDKISKVISDTKELIDYALKDSDNRISLITFESTSTILSDFTNDKDVLIEKLDSIVVENGNTNYNAALKNVNSVMEGYVKEDGRDITTLFLTDGYPNEDTPNQVGAYDVLKDKYPYMNINGVQYEMGKDIIDDIRAISDKQWVADQVTLNNVLFVAALSPVIYEKFIVNDYISEKFIVNSVDDIEVSIGKVELTEENGLQKIIWNLGSNEYATGSKEKMTIKLTLKGNQVNSDEQTEEVLLPTNKKESITSKLEDENEKTVNSSDTPVLSNMYNVNYNTNAPDECELDNVDSEKHIIYKTVKKKTDELSCEGYVFKGWEIEDKDSKDVTSVGNDYFIMPAHDITMRATWTKQSITKTMDGAVHDKATLYKVLKKEAENKTYAAEYTGEHQDSMDKSKSTKSIYYWKAYYYTTDAILDKNNVIFAGQCWQMIRTTDTGGVKLLYNGEPEDGKCLSTRGKHVGYSGYTTKKLNTSYYYGTSYTYDSVNKSFSLSGTVTTGTIETEKYTCLSTGETGTCTQLYYVDSLSTGTTYNVFSLNASSAYSQFGTLQYNKSSISPADVGYMYNSRYEENEKSLSQNYYTYNTRDFKSDYWFADSVTYDESTGMYTLDNPYQISSITDDTSPSGKYTFMSSDLSTTYSKVYYIGAFSESKMYFRALTGGENTLNNAYTYGDSYTVNNDGTYTINDPTTFYEKNYYENYDNFEKKYVCKNAENNTCSDLWYITDTYNIRFGYVSTKDKFIYGNSFIYENEKYKLKDTKVINAVEMETDSTVLKNHHYTCFDETGECATISYVYALYGTNNNYMNLNNGKSVEDALKEMLLSDNVNKYNSIIKIGIDAWYEKTLLDYSDYLEDTIFCNDRSISSLNGWNPNGENSNEYHTIKYKNYSEKNNDLSCINETDKFSTENEKAKLKYKVGLASVPEMALLGYNDLRVSGDQYWLISPYSFSSSGAYVSDVKDSGYLGAYFAYTEHGVRPAISLKADIEYSSGDGSMENPYVIDTE